ncbi:MAG: chlorophyllide reductase subunit Y, partial [Erythrobacter sp.]
MSDHNAFDAVPRAADRIDLDPVAGACASKDTMNEAARAAGKSDILDQYAADYPVGPHDQPQSMCPAFG